MCATYTCLDCDPEEQEIFSTIADLEAHIASDHLNLFPYECEKCKFAKFPSEYALISHYHNDHSLAEFTIKYRHSPELLIKKKELQQKLKMCLTHSRIGSEISHSGSSTMDRAIKVEDGQIFEMESAMVDGALGNEYYDGFLGVTLSRHEEEKTGSSLRNSSETGKQRHPRGSRSVKIGCALCSEIVARQRSSMVYHANTRHGKYELYECNVCQRKWQTIARSDVIKHFKSHHNIASNEVDDTLLKDRRKEFAVKLNAITDRCFPNRKKKRMGYCDVVLS